MADLLEQIEPALEAARALQGQADELRQRLAGGAARTEGEASGTDARGREVLARSQALVGRLRQEQARLEEGFGRLSAGLRAYRDGIGELDRSCRREAQAMLEAVGALQSDTDRLTAAVAELRGGAEAGAARHLGLAQAALLSVPPRLGEVAAHLQGSVRPAAASRAQEAETRTIAVGRQLADTVIPSLVSGARRTGDELQAGAVGVRDAAHRAAVEIQAHTEVLVRELAEAAQQLSERSGARLVRLATVVPEVISEFQRLRRHLLRLMKNLRGVQRRARGVLELILDVVRKLVRLLERLEAIGRRSAY